MRPDFTGVEAGVRVLARRAVSHVSKQMPLSTQFGSARSRTLDRTGSGSGNGGSPIGPRKENFCTLNVVRRGSEHQFDATVSRNRWVAHSLEVHKACGPRADCTGSSRQRSVGHGPVARCTPGTIWPHLPSIRPRLRSRRTSAMRVRMPHSSAPRVQSGSHRTDEKRDMSMTFGHRRLGGGLSPARRDRYSSSGTARAREDDDGRRARRTRPRFMASRRWASQSSWRRSPRTGSSPLSSDSPAL